MNNKFLIASIVFVFAICANINQTFGQLNLKHPATVGSSSQILPIEDFRSSQFKNRPQSDNLKKFTPRNFDYLSAHTPGVEVLGFNKDLVPCAIEISQAKLKRSLQTAAPIALLDGIKNITQLLHPEEELTLVNSSKDELGIQHFHYQQLMNGVPIWGSEMRIHAVNGAVNYINGNWYKTEIRATETPQISQENVEAKIKSLTKYKDLQPSAKSLLPQQQISSKLVYYKDAGKLKLAYATKVYPNLREGFQYFTDATSGEILDQYSLFCGLMHQLEGHDDACLGKLDGAVTATATDLNGISRSINTYQVGSSYYMIDASRAMFKSAQSRMPNEPVGVIWTLNGNNNSPANDNFDAGHFISSNNSWNSPASVSAHYNAGKAYEYYLNTHGRNSINNQGGNVISLVNITEDDGSGMDNAFWNGAAMFYGNGKTAFFPLAKALDVAGHEISHGVVETTANLEYRNESGALNESFADIFGAMIDRDDWKMGEDCVRPGQFPSGALRDLSNPHNGGTSLSSRGYQPQHMNEKYTGTQDNGGVHINSGIPNFAYYKYATRITKEKAEKVFYRALTQYMTSTSKFIDLRLNVIKAATDLYGANSTEVNDAKTSFDEVGILDGQGTGGSQTIPSNPGSDLLLVTQPSKEGLFLGNISTGGNPTQVSSKTLLSRPNVTDDGVYAVFIANDKKMYALEFNWSTGAVNEILIQNEAIWRNVAISKDGSKIAGVTDFKENKIIIFDLDSNTSKDFIIKNPTTAQNVVTESFQYADALEWDHTGEFVMFDGFNKISGTPSIEYWDVGFVYVWDNASKAFADGFVSKLFNGLPENVSIGNPVFSKNSPNIIAFDYIEDGNYYVLGSNIETGSIGEIAQLTDLGYPCYSRTDTKILYDQLEGFLFPVNNVKVSNLASDKINKSGEPTTLIGEAKWGVWFSNGARTIATKESSKTLPLTIYPNPSSGLIRLVNTNLSGAQQYQIMDLNGKLVARGNVSEQINVEGLSQGLYFVKIQDKDKTYIGKFIKSK